MVGDVGGTVWVLYGEDRFAWNGLTIGVSSAIAPLLISQVYFASRGVFPGLVWLAGAALHLLCLPIFFSRALKHPPVEVAA